MTDMVVEEMITTGVIVVNIEEIVTSRIKSSGGWNMGTSFKTIWGQNCFGELL